MVGRGLVPLSVQTGICQASLPAPPSVHSSHSFSKSAPCLPGALGCGCRGQEPAGAGKSPLSPCGLPWTWLPARRGGRRKRRMKRSLAGQGHRCHQSRRPTCAQTQSWGSLGTESLRGPARSDGCAPAASQPALSHPQGSTAQMSHPLVVAPPLLSLPQTCMGWQPQRRWESEKEAERMERSRRKVAGKWWQSLRFYLVLREVGWGHQACSWIGARVCAQMEGG